MIVNSISLIGASCCQVRGSSCRALKRETPLNLANLFDKILLSSVLDTLFGANIVSDYLESMSNRTDNSQPLWPVGEEEWDGIRVVKWQMKNELDVRAWVKM